MTSKITKLMLLALVICITSCTKDEFSERDAIEAQKELLNLKYQHELDLETLKQKGANAMQQLINSAALEQLKYSDSLSRASAVAAAKQDYSVVVVDVITQAPVADADVFISSQGKVITTKTNAQGIAAFSGLYLFPTSSFLISKDGFAATQVLQKDITFGPVRLWNTKELTNEISGTLFIETDLTNTVSEKVGANVLVTASVRVPSGINSSYKVSFPTYTDANGMYALKLPATPNGYSLSFAQVQADQKLYINGLVNEENTSVQGLPYIATIKTYFNVNSYNVPVPTIRTATYLRLPKDKTGKSMIVPVNYYYGNNLVFLSAVNDYFEINRLNIYYYYNNTGYYEEIGRFTYEPNAVLDVELLDITGKIIRTAPLLSASTNSSGKLNYSNSPEGGSGYVHLKRDNAGNLLPNAKGEILRAASYDTYSNLYTLNFDTNLNTYNITSVQTEYLLPNKGDKKIVNFYYGSGDSRDKQVN